MMCIFGKVFCTFDDCRNRFRLEMEKKFEFSFCISLTYS